MNYCASFPLRALQPFSLYREKRSHCADCMRSVCLVKQKALQWQRVLQCSATIQLSCRQGAHTHTASPLTLLLWKITRGKKRVEGWLGVWAWQRIRQVLKEELETCTVWVRGWHRHSFVPFFFCTTLWFTSEAKRACCVRVCSPGLEQLQDVCVIHYRSCVLRA